MNQPVFAMWRNSILFSICIYLVVLAYVRVYTGEFSLAVFSNAMAGTGGLLTGMSFVLSGLSYFFTIFDSKLQYRKYLGLTGYWFALFYAISIVFRYPESYITNLVTTMREPQAIMGFVAMTILTGMMIISHSFWMKRLGKHWRELLRVGYFAYGLLVMRAFLLEQESWAAWIESPSGLPPMRLVLSFFALSVIALRLIMEISMQLFPRPVHPTPAPTVAPPATLPNPPPVTPIS